VSLVSLHHFHPALYLPTFSIFRPCMVLGNSKLAVMNGELNAVWEKLAAHNAKLEAEAEELQAKVERLEALADEAERIAEQMAQLRQQSQCIEAEKEFLLAS